MKLEFKLQDTEYPFQGFDHTREIARAFLFNDEGKVAIHRIYRDDMFCKQGYFETPGGGIDEYETPEEACKRECFEEIGCQIKVLKEIAIVEDAYNLIKRKNINHYYLAHLESNGKKHFESEGDQFIQETLWVSLEEAIKLYEEMPDEKVSLLVKQRELPILKAIRQGIFN